MGSMKPGSGNVSLALMITTSLLSGCGGSGGVDLDIPIVTPLDGQWTADTGEALRFNGFSQDELYFSESFNVDVTLENSQNICGASVNEVGQFVLQGTIQNGEVELFVPVSQSGSPCMSGYFADLRTLRVDVDGEESGLVFMNTRVDVDLETGLWVSSDVENSLRLKFESPGSVDNDTIGNSESNGCLLVANGNPIPFSGRMNGFNTITGEPPVIPEVATREPGNPVLFNKLVFVDNVTITLEDADGKQRTLMRIPNVDETRC